MKFFAWTHLLISRMPSFKSGTGAKSEEATSKKQVRNLKDLLSSRNFKNEH